MVQTLTKPRIKIGISSCLLGQAVRFDGGHRNNRFCRQVLGHYFEFTPFCPEVGIGLPTPRKTIRLVGDIESPRAVLSDDSTQDFTTALSDFADRNQSKLAELCGYILCKASPSCGMERVKLYAPGGQASKKGVGIFAARLHSLFPDLPLEEDGRLNDPNICDSFIKRVYIYQEWRQMLDSGLTLKRLHQFHARHKFNLLAHNQGVYRQLGPFVATMTNENLPSQAPLYFSQLMLGMKKVATRKNNTNVLMHIQGFLKNKLSPEDKEELTACILDYNQGHQPILSALTLLQHHFKKHPTPYIDNQSFLSPYPKQLAIRVSTR